MPSVTPEVSHKRLNEMHHYLELLCTIDNLCIFLFPHTTGSIRCNMSAYLNKIYNKDTVILRHLGIFDIIMWKCCNVSLIIRNLKGRENNCCHKCCVNSELNLSCCYMMTTSCIDSYQI